MEELRGKRFGEERALYGRRGVKLLDCSFSGEEDGESALKESSDVELTSCLFDLRYPLWHASGVRLVDCKINETCRAPFWYSKDVCLQNTKLYGTKAIRECCDVRLTGCHAVSEEFAWFSDQIHIQSSRIEGAYFMLRSRNVTLKDIELYGKYSLQYVEGGTIENCLLDTKDSLWHAKGITVKNSVIKGEYLAWYSEDVTFIGCKIYGTQPFCYCKGLRLVDCEMHECDLAFEKSEVEATLLCPIDSIKNPLSGRIELPFAGEVIMDDPMARGEIVFKK